MKDETTSQRSIIGVTGVSDIMTLPELMVLGLNQFSHLYDDVPVAINDDRNASTLSGFGTVTGSSWNDYDKALSRRKALVKNSHQSLWPRVLLSLSMFPTKL
jgi:hypothetical protein